MTGIEFPACETSALIVGVLVQHDNFLALSHSRNA